MIVLDTNVISEPLRSGPSSAVITWLDQQPEDLLAITSITLAELRTGVAILPAGRRRDHLGTRLETDLVPSFAGRVFDFDDAAASSFAALQAQTLASGNGLPVMDALIAGICHSRNATLATRNTKDFEATGIRLINPWLA
ncbi:MAG: type II toxin-antitoxin system VapC family toxin [Galactobacter sp.]